MRKVWPIPVLLAVALGGCLLDGGGGDGDALVAAAHPLAVQAGLDVLRAGGNAVDAAAAVQFALNVVEPYMSGVGGGAFMMIWLEAEGRVVVLDGRETAPAASTPDQFQDDRPDGAPRPDPRTLGTAVGVPGTLRLVETALQRYGTVPLSRTLDPAIRLAEGGFEVGPTMASFTAMSEDRLRTWPASAGIFLVGAVCLPQSTPQTTYVLTGQIQVCTGGRPLQEGDRLLQPDLARTLRTVQQGGSGALYTGVIGQAVVDAQAQRDGRMTRQDLAAYRVVEREPLRMPFGRYEIVTMPPPGGGIAVAQALGLLEPLGLDRIGVVDAAHWTAEALHLAAADRAAYVADPAYVDVPVAGLLDPAYLDERRGLLRPDATGAPFLPGAPDGASPPTAIRSPLAEGRHTTHFVVRDGDGNIVTMTTTIETVYGSGMVVPGWGFLLNNELTDFDAEPGGVNEVGPGKRPRSAMSPTLVFEDGEPMMALGSPGGPTIVSTVVEVLAGVLVQGLGLQAAIDDPRYHAGIENLIVHEPTVSSRILDGLRDRGHATAAVDGLGIGNVQALLRQEDGAWVAAADSRRDGGYGSV